MLSNGDPPARSGGHTGYYLDGLLIGAGEDPSLHDDRSAAKPSTWGRIKGLD